MRTERIGARSKFGLSGRLAKLYYMVDQAKLESTLDRLAMPQHAESDESAIVRKVQSGDKDEFRHLVLRYKDMVYALVLRQVGRHDLAEEIAQDVFVRAFLHIRKFRFEAKFSTWLTRITLNQTHSYFSSKRFRQQCSTESFDQTTHDMSDSDQSKDLEEEKEHAHLMQSFRNALGMLKPKFREVLVLCGLEGKSYQEAAEVLAVPVGTIRSRLNKARLLVKEKLDE